MYPADVCVISPFVQHRLVGYTSLFVHTKILNEEKLHIAHVIPHTQVLAHGYICKPSKVEMTNCFSSLYWSSLFSLSLCNPSKYLTSLTLLSYNILTTSGGLFHLLKGWEERTRTKSLALRILQQATTYYKMCKLLSERLTLFGLATKILNTWNASNVICGDGSRNRHNIVTKFCELDIYIIMTL